MQTEQDLKELLERYLNGTATPKEQLIVEQWYEWAGDPSRENMLLTPDEQKVLLQKMYKTPALAPYKKHTRTFFLFKPGWRAAAVWLGLIALGIWAYRSNWLHTTASHAPVAYVTIQTGKAELKHVSLPDSSEVWINANSTLRYATTFNANRELQLEGEAVFSVTHDSSRPFVVHTSSNINTRVLGTRFDVSSYTVFNETKVSVLNGKVQVSNGKTVLDTVTRQQALWYSSITGHHTKSVDEQEELLPGWTKNEWNFRNMSITDLRILLSNRFGITINNKNKKGANLQTNVSVNFTANQSAQEIATIFCSLADCTCTWKEDKLQIQ